MPLDSKKSRMRAWRDVVMWRYFSLGGLLISLLLARQAACGAGNDNGAEGQGKPAASSGVVSTPVVIRQWPSVDAFLASDPTYAGRFKNQTIRTDIHAAATLAVHCLAEHMNWDRCRLPPLNDPANRETTPRRDGTLPELYWEADCTVDGTGRFGPVARSHPLDTGVAHVIGRALWAMLLTEQSMGIAPPIEPLDVLSRYCRAAYDNPDHLGALIDPGADFRRAAVCHDQREGFLGLLALARVRRDPWAAEELQRVLAALENITDAAGHLSLEKAKQVGLQAHLLGTGNDATTCGRLVEPLVEYYQFTGNRRSLKLAGRYAAATLASTFRPDGRFREMASSGGHIHSITSSLCGITRYAIVADDRQILEQCRRILDVGVAEYASTWGWVDEVMPEHPANEIGRGEINQTGDVIRCALLLGDAGHAEYYELAERYLRSGLLPVQHRKEDLSGFLKPTASPKGDWERDVPSRVIGGYSMFLPNDRMKPGAWPLTTQDIISGAVHALCECWQHRLVVDSDAIRLNLLLDYEGPELGLQSSLPLQGQLRLHLKTGKPVLVRIPGWVDVRTLRVAVDGTDQPCPLVNHYVRIAAGRAGATALVQFAVPCKIQQETVDGTRYTTTWVGDQVVDILPRGTISPLPF